MQLNFSRWCNNMFRRSLRILKNSQYVYLSRCFKLHTSSFPTLLSKFDKDLPNPKFPTPANKLYGPDTDILLDQLRKCSSLDGILELMRMHLDVMNSKHIIACLENVHNHVKEDKSVAPLLMQNPIFKSFCARLMKIVRLLEPQEVIRAYKTFCLLEVRNNTYIMQCLLKMLGAHLNNMTLGQLVFLNFLLHKQRHNSLVDGLKLAIPLVLQVQIDQQLDSDNLKEVVNCLQLCCRATLKPSIIQKIVDVVKQKAAFLSTDEAMTVIFSLLNIDFPIDGYNELMYVAFGILSKNIEEINPHKLCTILRTCRFQHFYHTTFFFKVADIIVSQKWNLECTYSAISHLHMLNFSAPNLLDHFAEVLCLESELYEKDDLYSPLNCIEYLTATSYRPAKVDEATRVLYSSEKKLEDFERKHPHLPLKFYSSLAMLGHFPPERLSKLLNEDNLYRIWSLCRKMGRLSEFDRQLLTLHWSLELYDEAKNFIIPPSILKRVISVVHERNVNLDYPLQKFIENGLGGSQFLQSGVFTEDGHVIDHIVAMRSGNYPVSLQNLKSKGRKARHIQDLVFVNDIIVPDDTKIIAVLVANENTYFRDPQLIKSWMDLKVRSLAKKKYAVVVINYPVWTDLPDREKIPYLMREIKQVLQDDFAVKSNYS